MNQSSYRVSLPPDVINDCPCIRLNPNDPCCHILPIRYFTEPSADDPNPKYPCGTCDKNINERSKAIQCDSCNYWNHIRCDEITPYAYEKLLKLPRDN